jgi:hypothetical protein
MSSHFGNNLKALVQATYLTPRLTEPQASYPTS